MFMFKLKNYESRFAFTGSKQPITRSAQMRQTSGVKPQKLSYEALPCMVEHKEWNRRMFLNKIGKR